MFLKLLVRDFTPANLKSNHSKSNEIDLIQELYFPVYKERTTQIIPKKLFHKTEVKNDYFEFIPE